MIPRGLIVVIVLNIMSVDSQLIFPRNVSRKPRLNSNKITDVDTSCTKDSMDVRVKMERPFKGVIFAKDFARECRSQGNLENSVTLRLPPNACGVRVGSTAPVNTSLNNLNTEFYDEDLFYLVTIVIQMDKYLQQSSDQERIVKCWLKPKAMQIKSYIIEEMIEKSLKDTTRSDKTNHRSGRMGSEWKDISEEEQASIMAQARAWMEILPSNGNIDATTVEVGEPTMLLIKSTLPAGVGFRITDCLAHDGLGESSQKLLDENGCPVDELIFPQMKIYHHKAAKKPKDMNYENGFEKLPQSEELVQHKDDAKDTFKHIMSYKHASTIFSAFKFPDRAKLHLTCGLELCKGECPVTDCKLNELVPKSKDALLRRVRLDKESDGLIIDRLQVYNSIEVLAPNIELENDASIRGSRQANGLSGNELDNTLTITISNDKTVCMSPSKMALAFCVLGLVFLTALVVAFISLIRARRKYGGDRFGGPLSFYTGSKSIFSGSGSSNSGFSGSKLLLTDSPYLEHQSTSSNWPYGRVL